MKYSLQTLLLFAYVGAGILQTMSLKREAAITGQSSLIVALVTGLFELVLFSVAMLNINKVITSRASVQRNWCIMAASISIFGVYYICLTVLCTESLLVIYDPKVTGKAMKRYLITAQMAVKVSFSVLIYFLAVVLVKVNKPLQNNRGTGTSSSSRPTSVHFTQ